MPKTAKPWYQDGGKVGLAVVAERSGAQAVANEEEFLAQEAAREWQITTAPLCDYSYNGKLRTTAKLRTTGKLCTIGKACLAPGLLHHADLIGYLDRHPRQ
jgi:hypothetical protein